MAKSGDLLGPLARGVFSASDVQGNLAQLARGDVAGRRDAAQRTVFKSVGTALEDLAAAMLVWLGWLAWRVRLSLRLRGRHRRLLAAEQAELSALQAHRALPHTGHAVGHGAALASTGAAIASVLASARTSSSRARSRWNPPTSTHRRHLPARQSTRAASIVPYFTGALTTAPRS